MSKKIKINLETTPDKLFTDTDSWKIGKTDDKRRIFVFKENRPLVNRDLLLAIPEDQINSIQSQKGSENCYLKVNGVEVHGSFEKLIDILGERVDIK